MALAETTSRSEAARRYGAPTTVAAVALGGAAAPAHGRVLGHPLGRPGLGVDPGTTMIARRIPVPENARRRR
ncbi:MAG: hypothetical protein WB797_00380 [Nocardioides sp.]